MGGRGSRPFYERRNELLTKWDLARFAREACASFYSKTGRPGLPPGIYFRLLLVGYFEGIDSERGIAWRAADSLALRSFLGLELSEVTPRPYDDLAHAAADRSGDAPQCFWLGVADAGR